MRGTHFAALSAFVVVAELTSFTKAAKRLGLSTATLSQAVRGLEDRLGVRLLNRTTRSVALTDAGERLLGQVRPLLDEFDAAVESVNAFRTRPAGHLRLTVPPPVSRFMLGPVLARFLAQYPEISIEVSVDSRLTDIVAERFDAGVRRANIITRDMTTVRMTDDMRNVTVASPHYLARHGRPQTPHDLEGHNCIRLRLPSGGLIPWQFHVDGKPVEFDVAGSVVVNDADLMVSAALEGIGVTYIFEEYVAPLVADGRLVSLLDQFLLPAKDGFFLFYPSRPETSAALKAFVEFLRTSLRASTPAANEVVGQQSSEAP
jgi:DNA-binding transcriptional LysR family regulator